MCKKLIITTYIAFLGATNCYALSSLDVPPAVGDSYGGDTVFCVSDTQEGMIDCNTEMGAKGRFGLIMANEDQANNKK